MLYRFCCQRTGRHCQNQSLLTSVCPLKSLSDWVLRDLSTLVQADRFQTAGLDYGVKAVEGDVHANGGYSAQFTIAFEEGIPTAEPDLLPPIERSAFRDIGFPEHATDIVYLLVDDLLHMSEARVERYHRVWCSSGAAMLVSSTTIRSFDTAGNLAQVRHHTRRFVV